MVSPLMTARFSAHILAGEPVATLPGYALRELSSPCISIGDRQGNRPKGDHPDVAPAAWRVYVDCAPRRVRLACSSRRVGRRSHESRAATRVPPPRTVTTLREPRHHGLSQATVHTDEPPSPHL